MNIDFELVKLEYKHKNQYLIMVTENGEDLKNTGFYYRFPLSTEDTFEQDVKVLDNRSKGIGLPEGKSPNSTYFLINKKNDEIVGAINIRHDLDEYHFLRGGHIGYYVCQKERNRGYAKYMLEKGLEICKQFGIERVLLTCLKSNIASRKTIIALGGILEAEVDNNGEVLQRFWINI